MSVSYCYVKFIILIKNVGDRKEQTLLVLKTIKYPLSCAYKFIIQKQNKQTNYFCFICYSRNVNLHEANLVALHFFCKVRSMNAMLKYIGLTTKNGSGTVSE